MGAFELKTSLRASQATPMGKLHEKDMSAVWKYGVAGDYNFDPLDWYASCGDDWGGRKGLRDVELGHGRMAMRGITYFAAWEALTGNPIVENNMLFHPNLVLPLLALGYVGWNQIYELTGVQGAVAKVTASTTSQKGKMDELDDQFDIYSKLAAAPEKFAKAVWSTYTYW
jgi:hypothetical protein